MKSVRTTIGGMGNLMFKQAFLLGKMLDGEIPDVYVQSSKYWKAHKGWVKKAFSEGIGYTDKVAVHIRRGDYLKNPDYHTNLWGTGYYEEALKLFPRGPFLVFCKDNQSPEQDTADRKWCEENLPALFGPAEWEMAPTENSEWEDMNLMASCKSIIIANSTFSWWAAFLNPNPDKIVVCPKPENWLTTGEVFCEPEPEWHLI